MSPAVTSHQRAQRSWLIGGASSRARRLGSQRVPGRHDRHRHPPGSSSTVPASSHTRIGGRRVLCDPGQERAVRHRMAIGCGGYPGDCCRRRLPARGFLLPWAAGWGPRPSPSEVLQQGLRDHLAELVAGLGTVSREELAIHVGLAIGPAVDDAHALRRQLLTLEPGERPW